MAVTTFPSDKFAFLYSGKADTVSQHNLKEVYDLLVNYLNYPAGNIKLYVGGTIDSTILDPLVAVEVTNLTEARNKFYSFATLVSGHNPGATNINTVLYYFTGGAIDPIDSSSGLYNEKHPSFIYKSDGSSLVPNDFKKLLMGFNPDDSSVMMDYFSNSYIQILFDIDKAGQFDLFIDSLGIISGTKTFSCSSTEVSVTDGLSAASAFTYHWCRAFKMIPYTADGTDSADTLTGSGESGGNELVSLKKAAEYGVFGLTTGQNPSCTDIGTAEPHYLGLPYLVIRDGSPTLWQSPDIRLYHPNPTPPPDELSDPLGEYIDDYEPDDPAYASIAGYVFKNHIHINIWNFGTHPVVHLKSNVILYNTGCSGTGTTLSSVKDDDLRSNKNCLLPVTDSPSLVRASIADSEDVLFKFITGVEYDFHDIPFLLDTHRCIRAKTELGTVITDPDMSSWAYDSIDSEAQRNINKGTISSGKSGKKAEKDIKGVSRKKFFVENPFKKRRLFRVVTPYVPELVDIMDIVVYRVGKQVRKITPHQLGVRNYIDLWLNIEEKAEFMVEMRNKVDIKAFERIELPFEIKVSEKSYDEILLNRSELKMPGFVTLAGFTIELDVMDANLNMQIKDEKGNVAALTKVVVESADGLHKAELVTDKNGILRLEGINPAKYRISVIGRKGKSPKPIIADLKKVPNRMIRVEVRKNILG
jgi:hypothetical protein